MSYRPFTWPLTRSWVDGGGIVTFEIVTCRPWAANRPWSWAMYRPAESMAGNGLTTMFVFSSLSRGAPPPEPPAVHPAASIVAATADAMSAWRGFILAPSGIEASLATPRPAGWAPRSAAAMVASRMIIRFRTVRHMPNGTACPNPASLRHQYSLYVVMTA